MITLKTSYDIQTYQGVLKYGKLNRHIMTFPLTRKHYYSIVLTTKEGTFLPLSGLSLQSD